MASTYSAPPACGGGVALLGGAIRVIESGVDCA
jgi:hypothetical protein